MGWNLFGLDRKPKGTEASHILNILLIYTSKITPHNLINCSVYHCGAILKIQLKSTNSFLSNSGDKQTDKLTNTGENITS